MTKIKTKITLMDYENAREILKLLDAPVNEANIKNLSVFVQELGEIFEESYNNMLMDVADKMLAAYATECGCGKEQRIITVHLSDFDFHSNKVH